MREKKIFKVASMFVFMMIFAFGLMSIRSNAATNVVSLTAGKTYTSYELTGNGKKDKFKYTRTNGGLDLCQYFGQKKQYNLSTFFVQSIDIGPRELTGFSNPAFTHHNETFIFRQLFRYLNHRWLLVFLNRILNVLIFHEVRSLHFFLFSAKESCHISARILCYFNSIIEFNVLQVLSFMMFIVVHSSSLCYNLYYKF